MAKKKPPADDQKCQHCGASQRGLAADQIKKHAETCTDNPANGTRGNQQKWTQGR